jgi:hypothetical protein
VDYGVGGYLENIIALDDEGYEISFRRGNWDVG